MTMGLRLLRRGSAPAGRHSRAVPGPIVPGAAAALVAAADHWEDSAPQAPAYAESAADATAPIVPVVAIPVAPVLLEVHSAPPSVPVVEPTVASAAASASPAPVTLGFADGAQVDLDADDPRVRTFRAAAAALLETPRA
jgi:hypothetical protein